MVIRLVRVRISLERQHLHRQESIRVESEIHRGDPDQAADHQSGAGDQNDREGDFGGDEHLTAAARQRWATVTAAAGEHHPDPHA